MHNNKSIIYQNADHTITILDIPRSIEEAQDFPSTTTTSKSQKRRLISTPPLQTPYPSVEPKSAKALLHIPQATIQELLLTRHLQLVLEELKTAGITTFHHPRITSTVGETEDVTPQKRKAGGMHVEGGGGGSSASTTQASPPCTFVTSHAHFSNPSNSPITLQDSNSTHTCFIPPHSTFLHGSIQSTFQTFTSHAPKFNLIILDPPWPNRSVRRSRQYETAYDPDTIENLLYAIPLQAHLAEDGLVGIWITNSPRLRQVLLGPNGLLAYWKLELVEEWIWLKVTTMGEPMCAIDGIWRKPYEIFLLARKKGVVSTTTRTTTTTDDLKVIVRRVILAVPDLHSRKPCLRSLLAPLLKEGYLGCEIFARGLVGGWWGWGDEVLKFQEEGAWGGDDG